MANIISRALKLPGKAIRFSNRVDKARNQQMYRQGSNFIARKSGQPEPYERKYPYRRKKGGRSPRSTPEIQAGLPRTKRRSR